MTPQENSELIKYYLRVLRLRKEEYISQYQPTDWERLTREEQLIIAAYHAHLRDEQDIETQLLINQYNRENKEKKRLADKERYLAKSKLQITFPLKDITVTYFFLTPQCPTTQPPRLLLPLRFQLFRLLTSPRRRIRQSRIIPVSTSPILSKRKKRERNLLW